MTNTNNKIEEMVEIAKERLKSSRKYNWTGGFEQRFFEVWIQETLTQIVEREKEKKES